MPKPDYDTTKTTERARRWREVLEGERWPVGFGWKVVNPVGGHIRVGLVGRRRGLVLDVSLWALRWPKLLVVKPQRWD